MALNMMNNCSISTFSDSSGFFKLHARSVAIGKLST